jgi:hypothetical protein
VSVGRMRDVWVLQKVFIGLPLTALISFVLSNVLLDGPDPGGWWNFIPGMTFYASVWLILILGVAWTIRELASVPVARWRARRSR